MKKLSGPVLFDTSPVTASSPAPDESSRRVAYHSLPDDPAPFDALLAKYASGGDVRDEVARAVWNWPDSPMGQQIKAALIAAERHGEWKAKNC